MNRYANVPSRRDGLFRHLSTYPRLGMVAVLLLAGGMWFYVQHVVIGHQVADAAARDIPRGNLSDLYPRWLGARELLLHHRDPYSVEITREIQEGYYGRSLDPSRPNDPRDQQGFAYPLYVVFLLAPTIKLPFSVVQIGFFWLLVAATIASVPLWLRTLQWHLSWAATTTLVVLTLGSFQVLQGLKLQQLSLLVAGLVAASVALLAAGHLFAAGILLALATIKPQLVLPLAAWLVLWAFSDLPRRRNLAFAFGGTLVMLVAGAEFLLPGWIGQFRHAMGEYRQYNDGALSVLQVLISPLWGNVLAVLVLLVIAHLCWKLRRVPSDSTAFNWLTMLVLAVTVLVAPKTSPYNHVLLLPGVLLAARHWRIAWDKSPSARLTFLVAGFVLFWPWLAALALTMISVVSPATTLPKAWIAPMYTALAIPVAVCLVLAFNLRVLGESDSEAKSLPAPAS